MYKKSLLSHTYSNNLLYISYWCRPNGVSLVSPPISLPHNLLGRLIYVPLLLEKDTYLYIIQCMEFLYHDQMDPYVLHELIFHIFFSTQHHVRIQR